MLIGVFKLYVIKLDAAKLDATKLYVFKLDATKLYVTKLYVIKLDATKLYVTQLAPYAFLILTYFFKEVFSFPYFISETVK